MEYHVKTVWDSDAAVLVATSDDVPGLCLELGSLDALIEKAKFAVPELLAMNGKTAADNANVDIRFAAHDDIFADVTNTLDAYSSTPV